MSKRRSIRQNALISSFMTCTNHESEILTLFCLTHDAPICDRCNRTTHRRCQVKAVEEVAQEAQTQNDIAHFLERTRSLSSDMKTLKESRENDKRQIHISCRQSIQEVMDLKREVIEWIERLAKDMEESISVIEKKQMTEVENDIKATYEMSDEIQEIKNSFECIGNSNEDAKFVLMTKVKHKIDEGNEAKDNILKGIKSVKLEFHKSDQLVTLMSEITSIGTFHTDDQKIRFHKLLSDDSRICFQQISSVTRRDITIGSSGVTGCVFMPDGRLVVCEGRRGCFVKVFSHDFKLQSQMIINPLWDVAVVSENQVIVAKGEDKCLQVLNVSGNIAKGKTIPVGMKCFGVEYKNDRIYTTCHDKKGHGGTVKILRMTGDTVNTFNFSQGYPCYLSVNGFGDRIAVGTNYDVQCIDSTGTTRSIYTDSQLSGSIGVLFDSYNNFMVCGHVSNNIHVVNSEGIKQNIILTSKEGIDAPSCLAYRPSDKTLIIGQYSQSTPFLVFITN